MKKQILAALALVALASCAKENSTTESTNDQVAATFTAASITRVANNAWEENDKIGISMVDYQSFTATESKYENVPYTVKEASTSGEFTPDGTVIYLPVDGSEVDFYAYYPYSSTLDETYKTISVTVADQTYEDIDLVAAKVTAKTKKDPNVTFYGDNAFAHKLSKLTMTIVAADGVGDLTDLVTTIKGQYTTAKFNIYTGDISDSGNIDDIKAITTTTVDDSTEPDTYTTISEAILIPTDAMGNSTIEFAVGGNTYILDTKSIAFEQGKENVYTITLTRTGAIISGSTIATWGDGEIDSFNASDL